MLVSTRLVVGTLVVYALFSLSALAQSVAPLRSTASPGTAPPRLLTSRRADSLRRAYQAEHERRILDPALGRVPTERLSAIQGQLKQLSAGQQRQARAGIPNVRWTERGPLGFTGTLRTLLADPADPTGRKIWAGSTTGGLWVNAQLADPATNWIPLSDTWLNKNLSALAIDPANNSVRYAATGAPGSKTSGGGIWKSTDGGGTWLRLPATVPIRPGTSIQDAFSQISGLAVTATGLVLAGTQGGVLRSTNQGQSWDFTLAPQQQVGAQAVFGGNDRVSTVRTGNDGLVYVAFASGRLFRSTSSVATAWTEITPPNTSPYVGLRTELAVAATASGTAQVLYAAQIAEDASFGGYTLRWLMRSTNSGQTWQAMTRPVYPDAPDLDPTLGFGDQYFTLTASPDSSQVVYLTAYDRLYRSGNGGTTWSAGQSIGRTTAFLPLPNRGIVWSSDNQVNYAPAQQLISQGVDKAQHNRSNGFGGLDVAGAAVKNMAGSAYLLTGSVAEPGLLETPDGGSAGSAQVIYPAYPLRPFIDQNEPTVQVAATTTGGFLTRNTANSPAWDYYSLGWFTGDYPDGGVDYDSRSNTFFFWSDGYRKASGIGTDPIIARLDSGRLARPTYLKVGVAPNTLFAATINRELYKLSGTNEPTPTLTRFDGGTFPIGSTISSIEVGATDNELLVTLSNYGVQSVWYTTNAGATWVSKDLPAHGLPDLPVYASLFNPTNRKQVLLATELGVWATADITAANPGWELTNTPAPPVKQLVYRAADEHVLMVTDGRGLWETDVWTLDSPEFLATPLSATSLCAGSTFPVSFTLLNVPAREVVVRLSDATGDFSRGTTLATGTSSPLSVILPINTPPGTNYRLRLDVPTLSLTKVISNLLTVNSLAQEKGRILDRRQPVGSSLTEDRYVSGYICPGDSALLRAYLPNQTYTPTATYRWAIDGQPITGQTSATLLTGQTGTYSFTASIGSCQTTNADDFRLISTNAPTVSVLNPADPDAGPVCLGTSVPLGASYLGQRAVYHWLRNGEVISGAASPVLSVTQTGSYSYDLAFGAGGGTCTATATPTYLTFSRAILPPVVAVANDVAPTLCGGETLSLYASGQPEGTTYQWLQNGQPVAGQTNPFITVGQAGVYRLQVQRGTCLAVSDPLGVTASGQLSNGFYFYGSTTLCTGESLVLYAKNTSHTLQWTKNNVPIPGATGFSYAISTPGSYGLRYTSGTCSGTAVSVPVVFSNTLAPVLLLSERCSEVDLSTREFPRTGAVSFTWLRNGQPVSQGGQAYHTVSESGTYSVSVTNGVCGGLSKSVSISVGQPAKPVVAIIGESVRCPTSAVTLQRVSGPYSYWKQNGIRLPGSSSDRLVATESGVYSLVYEQGTCLTESAPVSIIISQPISATVARQPFIRSGQSAVVPIQLSGLAPWSFSVVGGPGVINTNQNPYLLTVTPSQSTSYSLVNLTNGCGAGTGTVIRVFVDGADVSLESWVDRRLCQPGDSVTYSVRVTNAGPDVAENLTVINRLPAGLSYVGSQSATTGDSLRYLVGNVPAGESRLFSFRTKVNRRGTYLNAVEVLRCDTPDPDSQPNTGTADGEDDAALADWRTTDTTRFVSVSPNPNGRVLPAVVGNQPVALPNQADLSLLLSLSKQVVQPRDTIQVIMQVQNRGGAATASVQTSLTLLNGTYSLDKTTWRPVGAALVLDLGQLNANATASRTVYWVPAASAACRAEVTRSSVSDPDSTPNNRSTRPGEDDEATADIRVGR